MLSMLHCRGGFFNRIEILVHGFAPIVGAVNAVNHRKNMASYFPLLRRDPLR